MNDKQLIVEIVNIVNPLGVIKITQSKEGLNVVKIEGFFDYEQTKAVLFECLSKIRERVNKLGSYSYFCLLINNKKIKELNKGIYLFDQIFRAFLQALTIKKAPNLNTRHLWSVETEFILNNYRVVTESVRNFNQERNEKHVL